MSRISKLVSTLIALAALVVLPTLSGNESIDLCGFERPQIVEEIWPVFIHDPGIAGEMEVPQIDILINREGKPVSIQPRTKIPEEEMQVLRMILPAMSYKAGNACEEPIEGYAKWIFDDYFVLKEPSPEKGRVKPPQPLWKVTKEVSSRLLYYSMTYRDSEVLIDFHLDKEGNLTKVKGQTKYGSVLADELFRPTMKTLRFKPAMVNGDPVESVLRLNLEWRWITGKEGIANSVSREPYHVIRPWPEILPLEEAFVVDAELLLSDRGIVTDVHFLSQMPAELSMQLIQDLITWRIEPEKVPDKEGPKSMLIKLAFDPTDKSPSLLEAAIRIRDIQPPKPIKQKPPIYPKHLRRAGVSGIVIVEFAVREDGSVDNLEVEFSSHPDFNKPTLSAIRKWKFEPGTQNGKPVGIWVRQPIPFKFR